MVEPLLAVRDLAISYGGVRAVAGVSLSVGQGEVVAILGSNGAGKSSVARAIVGLTKASGTITLNGAPIARLPPHRRAALGIGYVPEGRRVFAELTVRENLLMGAYLAPRDADDRMREVLSVFPRLAERARQLAATLSGGEQQMLAIGRALMRKPVLLVLDEPSLGLSPVLVQVIYQAIGDLRQAGMTILLAEQSAHIALRLADRACVLETGRIVVEGAASTLLNDLRVREAYLGGM
jgi:branched-chain amino acid transport system ATP-binding protein